MSGMLYRYGHIRLYGQLWAVADAAGAVQVLFGQKPLTENFEEVPCMPLDDIKAPASIQSDDSDAIDDPASDDSLGRKKGKSSEHVCD